MELSHLREFVHLADTLSFKRTAEHFYVSRSVISRHIAALEEAIGAKLLVRGGQMVQLTEVGKVFYRDAQIVLRDYDTALEHVRCMQDSKSHIVRVGYLRNAARPVIVPFVRYMQEHNRDLKLSLFCMEYGELRRAMEDESVDVALAVNVNPAISRNYRSTSIYTDKFYAVTSKTHPLASRTEGVSLAEISGEKLLLPDSFVYSGLSDFIDGIVERKTQDIAREYYRDIDMLYLKVQTEGYIALSSGLNNSMFGGTLAILPILDADCSFSTSAFYADGFTGEALKACREAFEACRDSLNSTGTELTFAHFD